MSTLGALYQWHDQLFRYEMAQHTNGWHQLIRYRALEFVEYLICSLVQNEWTHTDITVMASYIAAL